MKIPYLSGIYESVIQPDALNKSTARYQKEQSSFRDLREHHSITLEYKNGRKWYFNDHCFIEDQDGMLHLFGINNPYPEDGRILYEFHPFLSHFVTDHPMGDWRPVGFAIDESRGTEYVGAPFVFRYVKNNTYRMLLESLQNGKRIMEMAKSTDLLTWNRMRTPLFNKLGYTKRDPCVVYHDGIYRIYLCNPQNGKSVITLAETEDFEHFHYTDVLTINDGSDYGGVESPFVMEQDGLFYLFFTYAHRNYNETVVVASQDHHSFRMENCVTTLLGHASEIFTYKGVSYMSSTGPEDYQELNDHGIKLAKLLWAEADSRETSAG